jgi:hypothetical protein
MQFSCPISIKVCSGQTAKKTLKRQRRLFCTSSKLKQIKLSSNQTHFSERENFAKIDWLISGHFELAGHIRILRSYLCLTDSDADPGGLKHTDPEYL